MNWTEMKSAVESQMHRDPQRATLSSRAIESVEAGLRHLASVGYPFELAPRGLVGELRHGISEYQTRSLSIAEAVEQVQPGAVGNIAAPVFDAE
jgi:hypothetical protein